MLEMLCSILMSQSIVPADTTKPDISGITYEQPVLINGMDGKMPVLNQYIDKNGVVHQGDSCQLIFVKADWKFFIVNGKKVNEIDPKLVRLVEKNTKLLQNFDLPDSIPMWKIRRVKKSAK